MSRKPPKKSDMGKSWMKPRRDSRQMISPEYHLIVSEGTKTEPKYFEKIKETIDAKYRDRIHLDISGKGDNTDYRYSRWYFIISFRHHHHNAPVTALYCTHEKRRLA